MNAGQPSRTALAAATHRAAHQLLEGGHIFTDPLALRILGQDPASITSDAMRDPGKRRMRIFIAVRTRFAEDAWASAVTAGLRQAVVLGAGLDTLAYRSPFGDRLRIFEVDHPATQEWKRRRLAAAAIPLPAWLSFAPVDFERQTLLDGLAAAGFDSARPAFFTWLGVVPYLTQAAVWATLRAIASLPNGAHVIFDYGNPPASLSPESRLAHDRRAARVAELGEAWLSYFETDELLAGLTALGFAAIEDLGPPQIAGRYFPDRATSMPDKGGHIVHAVKPPSPPRATASKRGEQLL